MNKFEEKRQNRIDRLRSTADKRKEQSDQSWERSRQYVETIVPGQPILIGHHSEKRHRRDLQRSRDAAFKALDLQKESEDYEARARAAELNTAIFSDDPDATEKLADKIARLEQRQTLMIEANKAVRKKDPHRLAELGFDAERIETLINGDRFGDCGFQPYQLSNNSANIRTAKKRLIELERRSSMGSSEKEINGVRIVQNVDENRTQIFFPDMPSFEIRSQLKKRGFRWSRTFECWQRHLSSQATYIAEQIASGM